MNGTMVRLCVHMLTEIMKYFTGEADLFSAHDGDPLNIEKLLGPSIWWREATTTSFEDLDPRHLPSYRLCRRSILMGHRTEIR